jgi:hypothetical protein
MDIMSGERFTNARVHEWLTPEVDAVTTAMRTTRVQLNSAALWWFCRQLSAEQRADILGEYVKVQAMVSTTLPAQPEAEGAPPRPRDRRGRKRATQENA